MFKNYLKTTLRSLWKNKRFVFINIFGLGIALACCIVAYFNWDYGVSYDDDQENIESIYRINFVREFQGNSTKYGITPIPVSDRVIDNVTQVDNLTRFMRSGGNIKIDDDLFSTGIAYVDSTFFDVFTVETLYGDASLISKKTNILISDELANRYFGRVDVIGETLQHIQGEDIVDYEIAAVFKKAKPNSSIETDAYVLYDNYFDINPVDEPYRTYNTTILLVHDASKIAGIESELQNYVADQNQAREDFQITSFYLDPFVGMSVRSEAEDINGHMFKSNLPKAALLTPAIMAGLILLIACFNFTNTSIAMANRRLKEIGLRKVMGGLKKQLVFQFLTENILLCILSLIVGIAIAQWLTPAYSNMWPFVQIDGSFMQNLDFLFFLIVLILFVGIAAAAYPAFYISGFAPTNILKGTFNIGGNTWFTKILLTLQFSISAVALVMGFAFYGNAIYQETLDYGYDKDGVIYAWMGNSQDLEKYKNALEENPSINLMTGTKDHIFTSYYNDPVTHEGNIREVDIMDVSREYIDAMGMTLVEGRNFIKDSETDRKESIIINQSFASEFGWEESLGKRVVWVDSVELYVVGVVKDFYTNGLWDDIEPMMIRYDRDSTHRTLIVQAPLENLVSVNSFMEEKWGEVFPNELYRGDYLSFVTREAGDVNSNIVTMFIFLGLVALALTAVGLFSMVSLTIIKRMKEIGVRKVLGASIPHIVQIINKQYIIILAIASVLGAGGGYLASGGLMGSIWAYYQDPTILTVVVAVFVLIFVSAVTVGTKVFKAASSNPAHVLRSE